MTSSPQNRTAFAVVFDLEFTAWESSMASRWLRPGEFREVVQIGAVKVDGNFNTGETFDVLVRPRLNPVLSPYLERLTGISNEALRARGVDFAEAYSAFLAFADGLPIVAFGRDDLVLVDNLRLYGMNEAPPLPPYLNATIWLADQGLDMRGLHACDVASAAGVAFGGHRHNGLDDALSVATGIAALIARGASSPLAA
ncbi:MAG: exonuclease domain-containing protein [Alphaproteobacteria bacterium]|nr:exonuclease domain-containing protein [Alphaproteobacteria bacterium]